MKLREHNFKITLRGRKLKSTIHFPLKSALLYIRHSHVECSGVNPKQKQLMTLMACAHTARLWIVAQQARLSVGFSRQDYWNGLSSLPFPGDLPDPGSNLGALHCNRFFTF